MGIKNLAVMGAVFAAVGMVFAQAATKVACVGNSITYGYGLNGATTYPQHLQTILGDGYKVENFGNSGKMFHKASQESYWAQPEFTSAYSFAPDIVVIELGTNDSKYFYSGSTDSYNYYYYGYKQDGEGKNYTRESLVAEMTKDYAALIDTFAHQTQAPKIYATLQPYANHPHEGWFITDSVIVNVVNPLIKEVATQKGVSIIDLHTLFNKPEWLQADSVHPNTQGAEALAQIIGESILNGPIETPSQESSSSTAAEISSSDVQESGSSESTDGLVTAPRTNSQIMVQGTTIQLNNIAGSIDVFDLNGNLIKKAYSSGVSQIQMDHAGAFIIKAGPFTSKMILK